MKLYNTCLFFLVASYGNQLKYWRKTVCYQVNNLHKYPDSMLAEMFNGQNTPTRIQMETISSTEMVNILTIFSTF